jgi:uncharacterized membrane protein
MTNSWDFPIYFLVLGATVLYSNYLKYGLKTDTLIQTFIFTGSCVVLAIIFSLPFQLNFTQIAKGIAPVNAHSPFWQLLVLWGYQWAVGLIFIGFLFLKKLISRHPLTPTDVYVLILLAVATFLIIIPEFFYVKDIYIPSYHRANTVFKLVYQSFMLYALVSGYIVIRVLTGIGQKLLKLLVFSFFVFIFSFVLYYPFLAIPSYYGLKTYRGLWGLSFLSQSFPDNFAAVEWLKKNVVNQPAIVEAVGDSYTSYNQISMATGLPTIEGWLVHEWLWRGSFDEPGKRAGEVQTIYETKDADQAYILLKKYDVKYVFVGNLERQKYKLSEEKFSKIGKIIFEQEGTKIYLLQ